MLLAMEVGMSVLGRSEGHSCRLVGSDESHVIQAPL